jgi:uncharacterized protein (DUF1800 family)
LRLVFRIFNLEDVVSMLKLRWNPIILAALAAPGLFAQSITVTPNNESVVVNGMKQMTAMVSGLASSSVTWSVVGGAGNGSVDAQGVFTAPPMVPSPVNVTVTATSTMNPAVSGSAILNIRSAGPVLSSLSAYSFPAGTSFTVTITGSGFQAGAIAYLNSQAISTTYVSGTALKATGIISSQGNVLIRVLNPGSMFSNSLTVSFVYSSNPSVSVSPGGVSVVQGGTQQFSALVYGSPKSAVWSVAGGGTISAAGLYTAPAVIPSPAAATITATVAGYPAASTSLAIVSNAPPQISGISLSPVPLGVYTFSVNGQGFINGSQAALGGTALTTQFVSANQLTVYGFTAQSGMVNLVVSNGPIASAPFAVQVGVANPQVSLSTARRFLQQAAFGPTSADAANVQQLGLNGWLSQQFSMPKSSNYQNLGNQSGFGARFLTNSVNQPDQLRQRTGFALSQIFVVSLVKNIWTTVTGPYEDMILTDSFANFRQILNDVTLAPAMGQFLDMANNPKANAANTVQPNENYAREVLQLLSIGTVMLNPDGTKQLDAGGNPIPSYDQNTIANFAKVFTGWTNAPATPGGPVNWGAYINPNAPMVAYAPMHDLSQKTLLQYNAPPGVFTTLAAGQNAQTDLAQALDNIFNHPNVGPFIGKQLIQHLVKSNPTPAYVQRVTAKFNDNGMGVRGDMQAVVTAILTDSEARTNDQPGMTQAKDGHLQEPGLFMAGFLRALGATVNDQNYYSRELGTLSQDIFNAPSVFNYYSPGYVVPGFGVTGPEFQIYTPYTAIYRDNLVSGLFSAYSSNINSNGPGTIVDLTPFVALAGNPSTLVDALDLTLTNGLAPAGFKSILVSAVMAETGGNLRKVQTALYLMLASSYYNVWN